MAKNIKVVPSLGIIQLSGSNANTSISVTDDGQLQFGESSNTGSLNVTGDLVVQGSVTAQEFKTEFVSASIIYRSGSTKFGDTADDIHAFTGSLSILSGSATINATNSNVLYVNNSANSTAGIVSTNQYLSLNPTGYIVLTKPALSYEGIWATNNKPYRYTETDGTWVDILNLSGTDNVLKFGTIGSVSTGGSIAFYTSGSEKVRITDDGNLAINATSTSGYKLYVNGSTYLNGSTNYFDGQTILRTASGATEVMRVASNGNVGIGTSSPSTKLEVSGSVKIDKGHLLIDGETHSRIYLQNPGGSGDSFIAWYDSNASYDWYFGQTSENGGINLYNYTQGGTHTTFNNNGETYFNLGNVGIGTTNPATKIDVDGTGRITDTVYLSTNANSKTGIGTTSPGTRLDVADSEPIIRLTDTRNLNVGDWDDVSLGRIQFYTSDTTSPGARALAEIQAYSGPGAASGPEASLRFKTSDISDSSAVDRMVIDAQGRVGIGTTSPTQALTVAGNILQTSNSNFIATRKIIGRDSNGLDLMDDSGTNGISIKDGGNVQFTDYGSGNNTGTAAYRLSVDSSGNIIEESIGAGAVDGLGSGGYITRWEDTDTITSSSIYENNGSIGIGTTSPSRKLHVYIDNNDEVARFQSAQSNDVYVEFVNNNSDGASILGTVYNDFVFSPSGSETVRFKSNGNVGIGTTNPGSTLDVNGTIRTNSTFQFYNTGGSVYTVGTYDASYYKFLTSGTERVRIDTSGNVGIGTTSPSASLSIGDGTTSNVNVYLNKKDNNTAGYYVVNEGNPSGRTAFIRQTSGEDAEVGTSSTNNLSFLTNDTVRVHIDGDNNNGNVGIGTTNVSARLHLSGSTGSSILRMQSPSANTLAFNHYSGYSTLRDITLSNNRLLFLDSGAITTPHNIGIGLPGTTAPSVPLHVSGTFRHDGSQYNIQLIGGSEIRGSNAVTLRGLNSYAAILAAGSILHTAGTDHIFRDTNSNALVTIKQAGNVGIGTTNPSEKLTVSGSIDIISSNSRLLFGGNRAIEGSQNGSFLTIGEGYGSTIIKNGVTLQGDLTVDGIVTAQEFHTEFVSASIVYQSGSTKFGDTSDDLHEFTGSLKIKSGDIFFDYNRLIGAGTAYNNVWNRINMYNGSNGDMEITMHNTGWYLRHNANMSIDGNVGIGTTSPSYKLQVNGTARFGDGSPYLKVTSTSVEVEGSYLFASYQSGVSFYAYESVFRGLIKSDSSGGNALKLGDTVERMRIVDGNVGIGTTAPSGKLEVQTGYIISSGSGAADLGFVLDRAGLDTYQIRHLDGGLTIYNATDSRKEMTFLGDGNVGIGTTNPATKLTVNGGSIRNTYNANNYSQMGAGGSGGYINGYSGGSEKFIIRSYASAGVQAFFTAGNVGIGTTSPRAKLDIQDSTHGTLMLSRPSETGYAMISGSSGLGFEFKTYDAGEVMAMKIANDGKVGIGTDSPNAGLEVANGGDNSTLRITRNGNSGNYLQLQGGSSGAIYNINTSGTQDHIFQTGGYEKMRLTSAGDLGIGTSAPTLGKLHVVQSSDAVTEGITVEETSGGNTMRLWMDGSTRKINAGGSNTMIEFDTSKVAFPIGKVGIGTSTPEYKLDIQGDSPILRIADDNTVNSPSASAIWMGENGFSEVRGAGIVYDGAANSISLVTSNNGSLTDSNPFNASKRLTVLESNGYVGIGTTSPERQLHLSSPANNYIRLETSNTNGYAGIEFENDTRTYTVGINNSDHFVIAPAAQFAGGYPFTIESAAYNESFKIKTGGNIATNIQTGNFGIGTESPSYKLEVAGTVSGSAFYGDGENLTNVQRIPKVEYQALTASIATNDVIGLPNGLNYTTSSNGYEYLEMFVDGIRLSRTLDYAEVSTSTVRYLLNVPSGSVITYKSLTLV